MFFSRFTGYDAYRHSDGAVTLSMPGKIDNLVDNHLSADQALAEYPMSINYKKVRREAKEMAKEKQVSKYRSILSELIFIIKAQPVSSGCACRVKPTTQKYAMKKRHSVQQDTLKAVDTHQIPATTPPTFGFL